MPHIPVYVTRIEDLGPWVPSVNEAGQVAFTSTQADGSTVVHRLTGDGFDPVSAGAASWISHPEIDARGHIVAYARYPDGRTALLHHDGQSPTTLTESGDGWAAIGPAGPTWERDIAFRATGTDGTDGFFVWRNGHVSRAAHTLTEPQGLPVVNRPGDVIVRGREGGRSVVRLVCEGSSQIVFDEHEHGDLGAFPGLANDGLMGCPATTSGRGTYLLRDGSDVYAAFPPGRLGAIRGGLLVSGGLLAVYATPPDGALGIYLDPDHPPWL